MTASVKILIAAIVVMLSLLAAGRVWACYAIIVGREASADGAVLVAHNEQNGGRRVLNFRRIPPRQYEPGSEVALRRGGRLPQVTKTLGFLWSENPGLEFSDGYLNDCGVAVVSDGCRTREDDYETLVERGEIRDGGIGYMLRRLVAQRARAAREGVELAGKLVERFGYVDSGRTYVIADPREAWLLSVVRGRRWVAQRVPDDMIVALPNIHIIGEVDLKDTENFLASDDLISYAIERGWYDPERGEPFSFRKVYRKDRQDRPDPRRWRGRQLAAGSDEPWPPGCPPPIGVKPKKKLTVEALAGILRFTGSPGTLCTPSTQEGAVFQLRSDIPPAIGCIYWRTTAEPATSVLTPWYAGIEQTPENYYRAVEFHKHLSLEYHFDPPEGTFKFDPDSAWWTFRRLQEVVHEDYSQRIHVVRPFWAEFENETLADQERVEAKAMKLWNRERQMCVELLTSHCARVAANACRQAEGLTNRLIGKMPEDKSGNRSESQSSLFDISVDQHAWKQWGFEYPVTYIFHASDLSDSTAVLRRSDTSGSWRQLAEKSRGDFFNGVECVRLGKDGGQAYVSVGFGGSNRIQLKFTNAGAVSFDRVARHYDARQAAYTLSNDNWGRRESANPGAPWRGMTDDSSDKYQASVHACRAFRLPVSVAVNSRMYGGDAVWERMQEEVDRGDRSWEPAVHTRNHPCGAEAYQEEGYVAEIVGCRGDILEKLSGIPYGQHLFEFILPCGYRDDRVEHAAAGHFLFLRDWNTHDNLASIDYAPWNAGHCYYGIGGAQTVSYDVVMEARQPKGRYYAEDVEGLNRAFDQVYRRGGIFYAMWHADRYRNSVIYDPRPGVDGVAGSTLMQHFAHVANRPDVWYTANGWLYSYRYVAQNAVIQQLR